MKQFYRYFLIHFIFIFIINLVGCCGGGGHGDSLNEFSLPDAVAANDGSLYYDKEGLRLSAVPGTFDPKTVIKIKKRTNKVLEGLKLEGKGVSAASGLYTLDFQTKRKLLYNMATASIILDSALSSNKKGYFGLERNSVRLVTSEETNLNSNLRASKGNNIFNLPFLETFTKIAVVTIDQEKFQKDPLVSTDNSQKDVENSKYSSNTHVELDMTTVDTLDNSMTEGKNASVKLLLKGEEVEFYKTAARLSTKFQDTTANKELYSASINLFQNSTMVALNSHAVNFNLDLNSSGIDYASMPRRLVLEGCYTGSDNLPICSQESIIYYNSPAKPYVLSTSPANGSKVYGLTKVTVNFSEPMKTETVKCSIKSSLDNDNPALTNYVWNGGCLTMDAKLGDKKAVYTVTVNKEATSKTGTKLAKTLYGVNESYTWSFTYNPSKFFVELTTPPHGSTNVPITSEDNLKQGPEIVLTFSEECLNVDNKLISLTINGEPVSHTFRPPRADEKKYIIIPNEPLNYITEYTIKVSKSAESLRDKNTLTEDYVATFTTTSGFSSGNGTSASPFLITNHEELSNVGNQSYVNKNFYFKVANDIKYDPSLEFIPIGSTTPFKGHFDGNNKIIDGFVINRANKDNIGLFGIINNSFLSNIKLQNFSILGHNNIGILAGCIKNSKLNNISVKTPNYENSADAIGGIAGISENSSITDAEIISDPYKPMIPGNQDMIGGIVGAATNTRIIGTNIDITIGGGDNVGGVAGYLHDSVIQKCNAKVTINCKEHNVGGLVGFMSCSSINNAKILADSMIMAENFVGGLVGLAKDRSEINRCSISARELIGKSDVGGLIGNLTDSSIENSCVTNSLKITVGGNRVGGLVGLLKGKSKILLAYSRASIEGNDDVGGLIGYQEGSGNTIQKALAINQSIEGSSNVSMHRIIGSGNKSITLDNVFALVSTVFKITGDSNPKLEEHIFNGKTFKLNEIRDKFLALGFNSSLWKHSNDPSEPPILK